MSEDAAMGGEAPAKCGGTCGGDHLVGVVVARAADDDAIRLDRDLDRAVARPVLGVDGVVLDRRVEPQPVALLAVVEGALEDRGAAAPAAARAPTAASAPAPARAGGVRVLL